MRPERRSRTSFGDVGAMWEVVGSHKVSDTCGEPMPVVSADGTPGVGTVQEPDGSVVELEAMCQPVVSAVLLQLLK